jgi:hypothetical protein
MLRADIYARALRASQNVKRAGVWVCVRCAWWVDGAWASAVVEGTRVGWRGLWNRLAFFVWRSPAEVCVAPRNLVVWVGESGSRMPFLRGGNSTWLGRCCVLVELRNP